jgi:hypothetical protein
VGKDMTNRETEILRNGFIIMSMKLVTSVPLMLPSIFSADTKKKRWITSPNTASLPRVRSRQLPKPLGEKCFNQG